jgi:hypothetical protein
VVRRIEGSCSRISKNAAAGRRHAGSPARLYLDIGSFDRFCDGERRGLERTPACDSTPPHFLKCGYTILGTPRRKAA